MAEEPIQATDVKLNAIIDTYKPANIAELLDKLEELYTIVPAAQPQSL